MSFDDLLDKAAEFLQQHDGFTLFSHVDADGLCATAILTETLQELGKQFTTTFIEQISSAALAHLSTKNPAIFVDMGSSHLAQIDEHFTGDVLLLDHHQLHGSTNALLVNPFLAELDGTKDISTAGIAWHVASRVTDAKELLPIALIGAQADNQEPFQGYNGKLLEQAKTHNLVETRVGARLYGVQTKPVTKLIAYSYDLKIPELHKNPYAAKRFLEQLGIPTHKHNRERYFTELSTEEQALLDQELIKRSPNPDVEIVHYTLPSFTDSLRDTREAATLLNACGRLGKPELAVKLLLGEHPNEARFVQREYRQTVHHAHEWFRSSDDVVKKDDLVIVNAQDNIPPSVAGTLCSVLVKGGEVPRGTTVVCLARNRDGTQTTKVSSRTSGTRDLAALMKTAAAKVNGEGGGHTVAAGAIIPTSEEDAFIELLE